MSDSEQIAEEETKEEKPTDADSEVEFKYNPTYHKFAEFLGVDKYKRENIEAANKMSFIYDWSKNIVGSESSTKIIKHVSDYIGELGIQFRGNELVNHLYQRARLHADRVRQEAREVKKEAEREKQPLIKKGEVQDRVKEGIKEVKKDVKRSVKKEVTKGIKEGIREAIRKAGKYG
jgi:hypothetical protein